MRVRRLKFTKHEFRHCGLPHRLMASDDQSISARPGTGRTSIPAGPSGIGSSETWPLAKLCMTRGPVR
eukprot:746779-Hanusia_phi.AAC.2